MTGRGSPPTLPLSGVEGHREHRVATKEGEVAVLDVARAAGVFDDHVEEPPGGCRQSSDGELRGVFRALHELDEQLLAARKKLRVAVGVGRMPVLFAERTTAGPIGPPLPEATCRR